MSAGNAVPQSAAVQSYGVGLFYDRLPEIHKGEVLNALAERLPHVVPADGRRDEGNLVFAHPDQAVQRGGKKAVPLTLLFAVAQAPERARVTGALAQSWSWPEAALAVDATGGALMVADWNAGSLDRMQRLMLFENVLVSVLRRYPPLAIHWQPTQQFVDPLAFLKAFDEAGGLVLLPGAINVRMFRFERETAKQTPLASDEEEIFMDTLGLAALGLRDLQCHFRGLDPQAVSRVLYNTSLYLFERGPVIDEGDTIPGIPPERRWMCRARRSWSLPDRDVLDLEPGGEHAPPARPQEPLGEA